jgi:hypothetical protein
MHRLSVLAISFSVSLAAQTTPSIAATDPGVKEMPSGIFRGPLLGWQGTSAAGDLTIRTNASGAPTDLMCHYDSHTYVARDRHRIAVSSLKAGEPLEVLADRRLGSSSCYARMVQVVDPQAERLAAERATHPHEQSAGLRSVFFTPRGDRTLAGIVVRLTSRLLTLKTKTGETTLALRPDTRYLDDGVRADPADLRVNTHVFVRAGKTIEGVVEAYQVMWGEILKAP